MERDIIHNLVEWKKTKKRKPLIITGVRQTGKTYILQEFGKVHFRRMHYLNFEDDGELATLFDKNLDPKRIVNELQFYFDTTIDIEKDLVIFDEIQECPRALTSLKYFAEKMAKLAVASAGSLLGVHLGNGSFPVGKVDMMHMYPMSFYEFLQALNDEKSIKFLDELKFESTIPDIVHQHLWERLKWYFVVGGLPEVVEIFCSNHDNLYEAFRLVRVKQRELKLAYYADVAKHSGKVNAMHIGRIWNAVPAQLAKTQDGSSKKFKFKGVIPGIDRYSRLVGAIDWLEAAGLVNKVKITNTGYLPFTAYTEESAFKLLLFDVGILGSMSDLSPKVIMNYDYGSYKGYFAENFVAQEFFCAGLNALYCWQEKRAGVEFLCEIDGNVIPFEVKSGWVTRSKSLSKFIEKYKSPYAVIFSAQNLSTNKDVLRLPLYLAGRTNT